MKEQVRQTQEADREKQKKRDTNPEQHPLCKHLHMDGKSHAWSALYLQHDTVLPL